MGFENSANGSEKAFLRDIELDFKGKQKRFYLRADRTSDEKMS
jgi:hypothetical protein